MLHGAGSLLERRLSEGHALRGPEVAVEHDVRQRDVLVVPYLVSILLRHALSVPARPPCCAFCACAVHDMGAYV